VLNLKKFLKRKNTKVLKLEDEKKASAKRIADLESLLRTQAESHKYEMLKLKEKMDEVNGNFEVEKAKREIATESRKMLMSFENRRSNAFLLLHNVVGN
jgi:hypothetical protein